MCAVHNFMHITGCYPTESLSAHRAHLLCFFVFPSMKLMTSVVRLVFEYINKTDILHFLNSRHNSQRKSIFFSTDVRTAESGDRAAIFWSVSFSRSSGFSRLTDLLPPLGNLSFNDGVLKFISLNLDGCTYAIFRC